jgi:hypothetical protein
MVYFILRLINLKFLSNNRGKQVFTYRFIRNQKKKKYVGSAENISKWLRDYYSPSNKKKKIG